MKTTTTLVSATNSEGYGHNNAEMKERRQISITIASGLRKGHVVNQQLSGGARDTIRCYTAATEFPRQVLHSISEENRGYR